MNKKLIYYFYLTPDFKDNLANRINLECLRRYARVFDSADIYLSLDDTGDDALIREAEHEFVSMPFRGSLSFKIVQNTNFCESKVIKEEILDKVSEIEDLVFFAHAKGYTNIKTYAETIENIQKWIVGCYFLSLEFINEVDSFIGDGGCPEIAYGSFPICAQHKISEDEFRNDYTSIFSGRIKYNWYFSGTFFWVNPLKMHNYINVFSPTLPKMEGRYFGERMFGNIFRYYSNGMGHNSRVLYPCNFYNSGIVDASLEFILEGDEHERFDKFYRSVISNV